MCRSREKPQGPSWAHLCGTDVVDRDVLTRTVVDARTLLSAGVTVNPLALETGTFLGAIAGYFPAGGSAA